MIKKLLLLSTFFLATAPLVSCNSGKVKLTLNSGIGTFADGSTTKVLMVNKGTSFSSLKVEAPTYLGCATYTWQDPSGNLINDVNGAGAVTDDYKLYVDMKLMANFFEDVSAMRGISTGMVAGSMMDAIARQPEAEQKIRDNFAICVTHMTMTKNSHDVMGMGLIGGSLMDAIARQPEATGKLQTISMYCYQRIINIATKDGRSEAVGRFGGSAMDAIARQPEASDKIFNAIQIACTGVETTANAAKAHGIGVAASSAMDAVARQPEASDKIIEALCQTIEFINNN